MIRGRRDDSIRRWPRPSFAPAAVGVALVVVLGGCGLPGASGGGFDQTIGDERMRDVRTERYAFARARLPITIEGKSSAARRGADGRVLTMTLSVGKPKYAVDGSIATRVALLPGDAFKATIDEQRQLQAVAAVVDGKPVADAGNGLADFGVLLARSLPPGPLSSSATGTSPAQLGDFRHETEVDPTATGEVEALQADLDRVAKGWGLLVSFEAVPVTAEVAGRRLSLAASRTVSCGEPICFRVPIPYRLKIEPAAGGWRGKLEAIAWLPNDGPVGALDVRNPLFATSGARATFANGMLQSLTARDPSAIASLLRIPADAATAAVGRR